MNANDMCDIFDGRLLRLCLYSSKIREMERFWRTLFQIDTFHVVANDFIYYLRQILTSLDVTEKSSEFLKKCDMGTSEPSYEELYAVFLSFNQPNLDEASFEAVCFNGKQNLTALKVNKTNHPLFTTLLNSLNCKYEQSNEGNLMFKNILDKFVSDHKWNDSFHTYKHAIKVSDSEDKHVEEIVTRLNINSMHMSSQVSEKPMASANVLDDIREDIQNKSYTDALDLISSHRETHDILHLHVKLLFEMYINESMLSKDRDQLIVDILIKTDVLWRQVLSKNFEAKTNSIALILSVLDYFNLEEIKRLVLKIAEAKGHLQG